MALGALPRTILADVIRDGLVMAGIGVVTGFVIGFGLDRTIGHRIEAISQPGFLAFVGSGAIILAAAIIASAVPAARAARVNAAEALRSE